MDVLRGRTRGDEPARARLGRPHVLLWALAALVAVTLVAGAVAGGLREQAPLDPRTPEGVTQRYLQAVLDRDFPAATRYLAETTAEQCDPAELRQAWVPESLTAALDEVDVRGEEADVTVRLRSVEGPEPFGGSGYSAVETFTLVRQGGQWRVAGQPWPLLHCAGPSR